MVYARRRWRNASSSSWRSASPGCGSGSGDGCGLWLDDWTGRVTYAWTIKLPPGSAYAGWDWGLNFTGGNVTSAMSTLVFDATGTRTTSTPSDATWKAAPDDALRADLPADATLTYPSYELSH